MTPGVPLVAASTPRVRLVVVTIENVAARMDGFRAASDMTTSEGAAGRDCIGDKAGNAKSKGDCKNSHLTTQHELPFPAGRMGEDANLPATDHVDSGRRGPKVWRLHDRSHGRDHEATVALVFVRCPHGSKPGRAQHHERRAQAEMSRRELKNMERSIKGIIDPIEDGMYQPAMKARMQELVQQKAEIEQTFHFAGIGCCVSAI
jgi:hypothetical protein